MTFRPDARSLDGIRKYLLQRLHVSLHHLVIEAGEGLAPASLTPDRIERLTLGASPFPAPVVFAGHAALLKAAQAGDEAAFRAFAAAFANACPEGTTAPGDFTIQPFDSEILGVESQALLSAAFLDDVGLMAGLRAPEPDLLGESRRVMEAALDTLRRCTPNWHAETAGLVAQILLAVPGEGSAGHFGGASSFDAFGALMFNARTLKDPAHAIMSLVHESAHLRLFLHHLDDAVLLNDSEARYRSPLRHEPRPMEGVFHAAWVSARMVAFARDLARAQDAPDWVPLVMAQAKAARIAFDDCLPVLHAEGRFTAFGQRLLADALEALGED